MLFFHYIHCHMTRSGGTYDSYYIVINRANDSRGKWVQHAATMCGKQLSAPPPPPPTQPPPTLPPPSPPLNQFESVGLCPHTFYNIHRHIPEPKYSVRHVIHVQMGHHGAYDSLTNECSGPWRTREQKSTQFTLQVNHSYNIIIVNIRSSVVASGLLLTTIDISPFIQTSNGSSSSCYPMNRMTYLIVIRT